MDKWLFIQLNQWAGWGYWFDYPAWFLAQYGVVLFVGLLLVRWFLPGARPRQARRTVILAMAGSLIALGLNEVISFFFYRPRPFMVMPQAFLLLRHRAQPSASFPSRDASVLFTAAAIMGWRSPLWGWLLWPLAFLSSFGRVFGGMHYPLDIAGSLLFALLVAWFLDLLLPDLEPALDRLVYLLSPGTVPAGKGPQPPAGESSD
ncbi:MAG: phosphatase PAP2 family protein [Mycobacterium leprae]